MWCADSVYLCGVLMAVVCSAVWGVRCVLCLLSVSHCMWVVGTGYGGTHSRPHTKIFGKVLQKFCAAGRPQVVDRLFDLCGCDCTIDKS